MQDYGGRFVLAKLNTDEAPQISAALQIRSIPLVVLFVGGRPVDQFMGALPEARCAPSWIRTSASRCRRSMRCAPGAAEATDPQQAEMLLSEALRLEPGHPEVLLDLATRWIERDEFDGAEKLLAKLPADQGGDR